MNDTIHTFDLLRDEGFFSDYAIGGGIATILYTEPIATIDIDIFATIVPQTSGLYDLSPIYGRLRELGYTAEGQYIRKGDQIIQLLVPPTELEEEAINESVWHEIEGARVRVFSAEHLVAIYLKVGRTKDRIKIQALLEQAQINTDRLMRIIHNHNLIEQWNQL